jgi:hypothetical protein
MENKLLKIDFAITQTHINTLQNIIARLSNYSMNCKTWAVTIVAALCVLVFGSQNKGDFYIIFVPIFIFWLFDCYYLGLEKVFRTIYDDFMQSLKLETNICDDIRFSLKKKRLGSFFKAMISPSTTLLYFALAIIVFLLYVMIK